jgi:hypothetical protein
VSATLDIEAVPSTAFFGNRLISTGNFPLCLSHNQNGLHGVRFIFLFTVDFRENRQRYDPEAARVRVVL